MMQAPPTPITARAPMSIPGVTDHVASAEPMPKITSPTSRNSRRP